MKRADEMTMEEIAGALGLTSRPHMVRAMGRVWSDADGDVVAKSLNRRGQYVSWPSGGSYEGEDNSHPTEHAALSRLYALRFPETTQTPTPGQIVEPEPATARESAIPFALDTRAVLEWLDSPVPLDEDRRSRFLRMAEAIGRGMGGGR